MSPELSNRIRAYAVQIENDAGHVTFAELEQMIDVLSEGQEIDAVATTRQIPSRWPRWAAVFAGALVLVMVAIALPVWFVGSGDGVVVDQTTTTVGSTTTTAVLTTVAPMVVSPMVDSWQRVGADVMDPAVGLFDLTQAGSRLVAVGFDPGEEDYRQNGVIFASEDGVSWTRLAEDDPALTLGAVLMYGVTGGGPGLVAVGIGCEDDTAPCAPHPTVWTSVDGAAWARSAADPDIFGESGAMLDVVTTDHGIVATGWVGEMGADEVFLSSPAVWLSPDGVEWSRVWVGDSFDAEETPFVPGITSLVASDDGLIVGTGLASNSVGDLVASVWVSIDGSSWERIDPDGSAFSIGTVISDVEWGSEGFVAVGTEGGIEPAIWQSSDGYVWTRLDTATEAFDSTGTISSVAALDEGYVAAGPHGFADQRGGWVTLWTSVDGTTWDRVHAIGDGYAMAIVATDGGIAVAGGMAGADNFHAAVWIGPTFDPAAPPLDPNPPAAIEDATGIAAVEEGVSCEQLATEEYTYAEAVSYWIRYELTDEFDLDVDGVPCAEAYDVAAVTATFGAPDALAVHLVADHATGTVEITGPAVDAGLVCAFGTLAYTENPEPTEPGVLWRWEDEYTCSDGSGTFLLGVDEYVDDPPTMFGVWHIVNGTGAYESLRGGGMTDSVFDGYDASIGRLWTATNSN